VGVGLDPHACILPRTTAAVRAGTVSRLPGNPPDQHAVTTLARQQVWSETANRLKAGIVRARTAGLLLGIAAAVLAMGAVQLADAYEGVARACGVVAGLAAGLTPLVLRRAG